MLRKQSQEFLGEKINHLTIYVHTLPVSGVGQSEEDEVKESGELSLQSLTDMIVRRLPGALSWRLALHTMQQIKKRLCLLDETHIDTSNVLFGLLLIRVAKGGKLKLKLCIPDWICGES